jgi:hypothetical protein
MATDQAATDTPSIVLRGVNKWFGEFHVHKEINLQVESKRRLSATLRAGWRGRG